MHNKPSLSGSETAAAMLAVAANDSGKSIDSYLELYFTALRKILASAADERWPAVVSYPTSARE